MKLKSIIYFHIFVLTILSSIFVFSACDSDSFSTNPAYKLKFSTDTVSFDTVFTTIGSATNIMKIYNPNKEGLKITSVGLERGTSSPFRINVDGSSSTNNQFADVEIDAKDSLFVFITVNIDPNNASSPLIETDNIKFITNGNEQKVRLEAYGQDVEILRKHIVYNDSTLNANKPYLIYDSLKINSNSTLTIPAGCRLYFYNKAKMVVYGTLKAMGTREQPIIMRGHRRDNVQLTPPIPYNYIAGQWNGVYLYGKSNEHVFDFVTINSGDVGIHLQEKDENSSTRPKLEIKNSRIHNFTYYGLMVQNADITVVNTEISNVGTHCVYLNGGIHTFIHCTVVNYFGGGYQPVFRQNEPAVMIMDLNRISPMKTIFLSSVVMGNMRTEFSLETEYPELYQGTFSHSYFRSDVITSPQFSNMKWYAQNDTVFRQTYYDRRMQTYFDFTPDSVSPLRDMANPAVITQYSQYNLEFDLHGNSRIIDGKPDAGAYEWQKSP